MLLLICCFVVVVCVEMKSWEKDEVGVRIRCWPGEVMALFPLLWLCFAEYNV